MEDLNKYEVRLLEGNEFMIDRDFKTLQSEGWELAGEISVKAMYDQADRILIPLKRKIKINND